MLTAESDTTVALTSEEWQRGVRVSTKRHRNAEAKGYLQSDGTKSKNGLTNHNRGAGAEIGAAKFYEVDWDATCDGYKRIADVLGCEVRSTAPDTPYLRIKMTDWPNRSRAFIAMTNLGNGRYRIEGWIYGYDGMKDKYLVPKERHSKKPEWCVPFRDLHHPFTLQTTLCKLRDLLQGGEDGQTIE